jgi:hypothetical protein
VAYHPKTGEQSFNSDWQTAVAWAQGQGIGPNAYLPVYQLDLNRVQNGEYPMGKAERALAIQAAHNPNMVSSAPSDNPQPSHVWNNAVSDVGKIATGIAGIFTGSFEKSLFNSAKTTLKAIVDPQSMEASTFGGTIGNWLNDTLLSFVPGAADIGTVLQHDPTLSGSSGFKALAEHPVLSLLDLVPGAGGAAERIARGVGATAVAGKLAARGGDVSFAKALSQRAAGATLGAKPGVTMRGQLARQLSVGDRLENLAGKLGPHGAGVGRALGDISEGYQTSGALQSNIYSWLFDRPTWEYNKLSDTDKQFVAKVFDTTNLTEGDSVRKALADPIVSPAVKQVIKSWMNGPLRFAKEEELFQGNIRPVHSLSGDVGMWAPAGKNAKKVLQLAQRRRVAERAAATSLDGLEHHGARLEALDGMLAQASTDFKDRTLAARQQVFNDPALQRPLTRDLAQPGRLVKKGVISRQEQLHSVVGEGGLADQFMAQVANRDPDQIGELAKAMRERLSAWGAKSVDAAEHPALVALREAAVAFEGWAKAYKAEAKAIDEAIHGTEKAQRHFLQEDLAHRAQGRTMLKDRHTRERDELLGKYQQGKRVRAVNLARTVRQTTEAVAIQERFLVDQAENAAQRVTNRVLDTQIMPKLNRDIRDFKRRAALEIKEATKAKAAADTLAYRTFERDRARLAKKHGTEVKLHDKQTRIRKEGMGQALADVTRLGQAVRDFHEAVADNPADQYRDAFNSLVQKHILEMEDTAALTIATDKYLTDKPGMTDKRLAQIRSDPQVIAELIQTHFHEIMKQPDLDPELAAEAQAQYESFVYDAKEQLKILIGQGFRVEYIPHATTFDERLGRDSLAPLIGRGIPKPDMAKEKEWNLTPHKNDFALGINKAVVQALQRDATIHMVEHYIRPMAVTQKELNDFLWVFQHPELRLAGENIPQRLVNLTHEDLGLVAWNPGKMFEFSLPRWNKEGQLYLPKPIVNALEQMERGRRKSLLAKSNRLFRYSILGLSPRYTAHVVFGGTMMLALRSNPLIFTMIPDAVRALRDGTLPQGVGGHTTELGFEDPIGMVNHQAGKDMHSLAVAEHVEQVQKVKMAAAKPVHILRALADINFRFTHYVRDLQASLAYLDGAAKVDRRAGKVTIEDPETGREISVSSERAVKEGIHHVQEVFGNLNRMSPLERSIAQSIMPFYGWQKHILGYVLSFPFDHPYRALVLSQLAFNASQQVPLGWPIRIQFLYFLGSPDAQGNVNAIDLRSLDPFRDVANYGTLTGFFEALNPALTAIPSMRYPQFSYGDSQLYPGVTYNAFYGIQTTTGGGSWINALEQFVPQVAAVRSAAQAAGGYRTEWQTNRASAIKSLLSSLNIPFVNPPVNLKQIAAKDQNARFETAKAAASTAFQSGDFSGLAGYKTVPNPLNTAYEITPAQLQALYNQALQANPGVAPIESLLPPPSPYGL